MRKISKGVAYMFVGVLSFIGATHFAYASSCSDVPSVQYVSELRTFGLFSPSVQFSTSTLPSSPAVPYYGELCENGSPIGGGQYTNYPGPYTQLNDGSYVFLVLDRDPSGSGFASAVTLGGSSYSVLSNVVTNTNGIEAFSLFSRFISLSPLNQSIVATSSSFGAHLFISSSDFVPGMFLHILMINNTLQNGIGGSALDAYNSACVAGFSNLGCSDNFFLSAGDNYISTSTVFFPTGQYNASYSVNIPNTTFLIGSILPDSVLISSSSVFYVVAPTALDQAISSTSEHLITALVTGATTSPSVLNCEPGARFDFTTCVISIFVPSMSVVQNDITVFRDDFLTRVPVGYITRFVVILTSSSTSMLPVLSATIPAVLPGHGSHITLDPNHVFDFLLNATSGPYISVEATSTQTFYQITSYYWDIIVYISLFLYILSRIIGSHLIPKPTSEYDEIITPEVTKKGKRTGVVHKKIYKK